MDAIYILITNLNPFETEFTAFLHKPQLDKSIYIIQLSSSIMLEPIGNSLILNNQYEIKILDKSLSTSVIKINQFCITKIKYSSKTNIISFMIDEGQKAFSQQINFKRIDSEIRIDINKAIKKISLISKTTVLADIPEFQE